MNIKSIIESLLFSSGEPVSIKKLAKILKKDENLIKKEIESLGNEYLDNDRGLQIIKKADKVQLASSSQNSQYVKELIKDEISDDLSTVSLETLAIIAYKGPITRTEVEEIRGVNCSFTIRKLLIRGLIERKNSPKTTRAYVYEISFDFLRKLGLSSIKDLPNYNETN